VISVAEALARCLALTRPLPTEMVDLAAAAGRVLARPVVAGRDQPPFAAAAMDGYAVTGPDATPGARLQVVGEAAAGHMWQGALAPGQALRIFTGAPVPKGAGRIVIQEDVTCAGTTITLCANLDNGPYIRPAGGDFKAGDRIAAPRRLTPADVALAAAMNHPHVTVVRPPRVALIATGDELVEPGERPRADQIVASVTYGLKALLEAEGARARLLPIARDTPESLQQQLGLAQGADMIVTVGGASVGNHDLVAGAAETLGITRSFHGVAMRPGKPLMAGRLGAAVLLGLPGNPVSAMVCGHIFLVPVVRAFLGLPPGRRRRVHARLAVALPRNGPREHYMRAQLLPGPDMPRVYPLDSQDSALLTRLCSADALLIREPGAGAAPAGTVVEILPLSPFD